MYTKRMSSVELKVSNIKKLMKRIQSGVISLKDAGINDRLQKLRAEGASGDIWANDLHEKYIQLVKNLNK